MDDLAGRIAALEADRDKLIAHSILLGQVLGWLARNDPEAFERMEAGLIAAQSGAVMDADPLLHRSTLFALEMLDAVRNPSL